MSNPVRTRLDSDSYCEEVGELRDFLESKMIGNGRAINRVALKYDHYLSPLWMPQKPIGSFMFLGPSGVGKTFLPELLAEYFFDDKTALTVVECGSYQERHEIARLLGSPPGYLGYDDTSSSRRRNPPLLDQSCIDSFATEKFTEDLLKYDAEAKRLTNDISHLARELEKKRAEIAATLIEKRDNEATELRTLKRAEITLGMLLEEKQEAYTKYASSRLRGERLISIVLFDEIEKAHPDIYNFLLEITAKGRTRLGSGKETSFVNTFLFMTGNLGSRAIADIVKGKRRMGIQPEVSKEAEDGRDAVYDTAMAAARKHFAPEFLGRIADDIVVFRPLKMAELAAIAGLNFDELMEKLKKDFPVDIEIEAEVKEFIIGEATDHPEFGARLLKNKLAKYLEEPLARMINSHEIEVGEKIIAVLEGRKVVFYRDLESATNVEALTAGA